MALDQALIQQRPQSSQHLQAELARPAADRLGRLQRPATDKHAQPSEEPLLGVAEEVVAPIQCGPQRLLPLGPVLRPGGQQRQAMLEPRQQHGRGEQTDARGRQLERQGQPIEPPADGRHYPGVGGREVEGWQDRPRPLCEQLDRGVSTQLRHDSRSGHVEPWGGHLQRRQLAVVLPIDL